MKIIRQIDVYDKLTEDLVDEIPVEFDFTQVKELIKLSADDPELYYQYIIEEGLQHYFEQFGLSVGTEKYQYFLCCYQDQ